VSFFILSISSFPDGFILSLTPEGAKGVLLFTGATASIRGNKLTSCFATGKHALRALAQSLAKEFGKENIHVAHAIIDGGILTERSTQMKGEEWAKNPDVRLDPDAIAKVSLHVDVRRANNDAFPQSYLYLAHQDRSAWTWELDCKFLIAPIVPC
jgi:NAD(P)-dependent dehydrogenase (short-subunit alcohol dehydrogenase family)